MNFGTFKNGVYTKHVLFSKAVLWKDRQLSLRVDVIERIKNEGITLIVFVDDYKREKWIFKTEKVLASMTLKSVGQEDQYYFPIESAKKVKLGGEPRPEYVLDKERGVYVVKGSIPTPEPEKSKEKKPEKQISLL